MSLKKCLHKKKNNKKGIEQMNDILEDLEMEFEQEKLTKLAAERMRLKVRLELVEREIRDCSFHFYVGQDGLIEVSHFH
jgi:DNA polymerase III sliding clamp (beta) subunit (PCNA family)